MGPLRGGELASKVPKLGSVLSFILSTGKPEESCFYNKLLYTLDFLLGLLLNKGYPGKIDRNKTK